VFVNLYSKLLSPFIELIQEKVVNTEKTELFFNTFPFFIKLSGVNGFPPKQGFQFFKLVCILG